MRFFGGLLGLALIGGIAIYLRRHPQPEAQREAVQSLRGWVRRGH